MKNKTIKILSTSSDKGKRIDIFLSEKLKEMTRSNIKKMINQKKVTINNVIVESQSKKVKDDDEINITFQEDAKKKIIPFNKKLEISCALPLGNAVKIISTSLRYFLLNLIIFGNLNFDSDLSNIEIFFPTDESPHKYLILIFLCLINNLIS